MPRIIGAKDLVKRKRKVYLKRVFKDYLFTNDGSLRTKRHLVNPIQKGKEELTLIRRLLKGKEVKLNTSIKNPQAGYFYHNFDSEHLGKIAKSGYIKESQRYTDKGVFLSINPAHRDYGDIGFELRIDPHKTKRLFDSNYDEDPYRFIPGNLSNLHINRVIIRKKDSIYKTIHRQYPKSLGKLRKQSQRKNATILFKQNGKEIRFKR